MSEDPALGAAWRKMAVLLRRQAQRVVERRVGRAILPNGQVDLGNPDATTGALPWTRVGDGTGVPPGGGGGATREPIVMGGELLLMGGDIITMGA